MDPIEPPADVVAPPVELAAPAPIEAPADPAPVAPDSAAELAELKEQLARLTSESAAKDVRHVLERAGVTDTEGEDVIAHLYGKAKAPEGGDKPTLAAWLADRANLPRGALAYLPAPVAPPVIVAPPVVLPNDNAGARPPPSGAALGAAAITGMIGDTVTYAANRDAIMARLGGKPTAASR